jgi:hypothetical protein
MKPSVDAFDLRAQQPGDDLTDLRDALLADKEWTKRSDRWIAEKCGVSQPFVGSLRVQVKAVITSREGKDGKVVDSIDIINAALQRFIASVRRCP